MSKILDGDVAFVNQLINAKDQYPYELWKKGCANNWMPSEVNMSEDVKQWKSELLSEDERLLVKRVLGFFSGTESLVGNNLLLSVFKHISDGACRQYILRQCFEESIHNSTIEVCCSAYNLNVNEVSDSYKNIEAIKAKDDFLLKITSDLNRKDFDITTEDGKREFIRNLFAFYIICEGVFFYSGFAMALALGRQNKLTGLCDQIKYTIRDECELPHTELLTESGWKKITDVKVGEKIAAYNKDKTICFSPVLKTSKSKVDHYYHIFNEQGHLDISVSENHRIILENLKDSRNLYERTAKAIRFHPYCSLPMAGKKTDGSKSSLTHKERFLIAFQADGSFQDDRHTGERAGYLVVNIGVKKERKKNRLRKICNDCNFPFKEFPSPSRPGYVNFAIQTPIGFATKNFKDWVSFGDINNQWCSEFIEEAGHWDGHFNKSNLNRITYGSVVKENVVIVQTIAALAGYRTHFTVRPDFRKESFSDYYRIQINRNKASIAGSSISKNRVDYDGFVYGVQVSSGMKLIRSNDTISVTGNSLHIQFGVYLFNRIKQEYPQLFTPEFNKEMVDYIKKAVELEIDYAKEVLPRGILGLNASMFVDYMQFIGNRRLESIGLDFRFESDKNPFPWLGEVVDTQAMGAFFERRERSYQQAGALVDDF